MALSDPIASQVKDGLVQALKDLDLAEIGRNVVPQLAQDVVTIKLPLAAVVGTGEPEQFLPGTTEHVDRLYPFPVLFLDRDASTRADREPVYRRWREEAADALDMGHRDFPGVVGGTVFQVEVVPHLPISDQHPQYNLIASGLIVKVSVRRPRR